MLAPERNRLSFAGAVIWGWETVTQTGVQTILKPVFIIKTGSTFPATRRDRGDFEDWTRQGLGLESDAVRVVRVIENEPLPAPEACGGVVVTGSHEMVTDRLDWSVRMAAWLPGIVEKEIPFLGICYGHQLLAHAMGGRVGYHPRGMEIGTVAVDRHPSAGNDRLFAAMPPRFTAHVTHSQSVLDLPTGAVVLAKNDFEPHHGFRIGRCAWGVQFHPEYDADIMRAYASEQSSKLAAQGLDLKKIYDSIENTPHAAALLRHFAEIITGDSASDKAPAARKGSAIAL